MRVYLKIKVKSLAAEAQIIRTEERKFHGTHEARAGLHYHRVIDVRRESRSACLAYGFLKGRTYRQMEAKAYFPPDWKRVEALATKYGTGDVKARFAEWKDGKVAFAEAASFPPPAPNGVCGLGLGLGRAGRPQTADMPAANGPAHPPPSGRLYR